MNLRCSKLDCPKEGRLYVHFVADEEDGEVGSVREEVVNRQGLLLSLLQGEFPFRSLFRDGELSFHWREGRWESKNVEGRRIVVAFEVQRNESSTEVSRIWRKSVFSDELNVVLKAFEGIESDVSVEVFDGKTLEGRRGREKGTRAGEERSVSLGSLPFLPFSS